MVVVVVVVEDRKDGNQAKRSGSLLVLICKVPTCRMSLGFSGHELDSRWVPWYYRNEGIGFCGREQ